MVEQLPEHKLACGSAEKVKLLLNSSHLEPQAVKPQRHRRDEDLK
jgi:hypothetical protein